MPRPLQFLNGALFQHQIHKTALTTSAVKDTALLLLLRPSTTKQIKHLPTNSTSQPTQQLLKAKAERMEHTRPGLLARVTTQWREIWKEVMVKSHNSKVKKTKLNFEMLLWLPAVAIVPAVV